MTDQHGSEPVPETSNAVVNETDDELLELAQIILQTASYETTIEEFTWGRGVFGRDQSKHVAVAATATVDALLRLEPALSGVLLERLSTLEIPRVRRDGYVVLLTVQPAEADQGEALFGITYNLRHVRRVIRAGVEPTTVGVARALRPVLPLLTRASEKMISRPLDLLSRRLVADGLDPTLVADAVEKFLSGSYREASIQEISEPEDDSD